MDAPLVRGSTAPDFRLTDARGNEVSSRSLHGQPLVLAFLPLPEPRAQVVDDALRAHLRGAGTSLFVITPDEVLFVQADDEPRRLQANDVPAALLLARTYGVARRDGAFDEAFFVVDAEARVRFVSTPRDRQGASAGARALTWALRAAADTLRAAPPPATTGLGRRELMTLALATAFAAAVLEACKSPEQKVTTGVDAADEAAVAFSDASVPTVAVTLDVNGQLHSLSLDPRVTLLDALRERLDLTGTKKGCDHGQCGACTVHVDGRSVNACLTLALGCEGAKITTIEGLAKGDKLEDLHPMQAAFLEHDAYQCGYCTPGQIMSAVWLVQTKRAKDEGDIREMMSGNICRCGAYTNIVSAVQAVLGTASKRG